MSPIYDAIIWGNQNHWLCHRHQGWEHLIVKLKPYELRLNKGRFRKFKTEPQVHVVEIRYDYWAENAWASIIDWIDRRQSNWNVIIDTYDNSPYMARISFSDPVVAVEFKLTWC